jgi:Flp pilus assembly pilin Flp
MSRRRRRVRGQGLIEYSLILAFVGLAIVGIMTNIGNSTTGVWSTASSQLEVANGGHQQHRDH